MTTPLLKVEGLSKSYPVGSRFVTGGAIGATMALKNVSFELTAGEILVIAGEAGSGKTTLARSLGMLVKPSSGRVIFEGREITKMGEGALRPLRRRFQFLFSDPRKALNPQGLVSEVMIEPVRVQRLGKDDEEREAMVRQAMRRVGLNSVLLDKRLTALSAAQRQRVALARILTLHPALIIGDDPARTLPPGADESFFRLLADLRQKDGMTFIWLVARPHPAANYADRLGILYQGELVELGETASVLHNPQHEYTRQWMRTFAGAPNLT
jgi:ABC-type glutathione transport system ATPase component